MTDLVKTIYKAVCVINVNKRMPPNQKYIKGFQHSLMNNWLPKNKYRKTSNRRAARLFFRSLSKYPSITRTSFNPSAL